MLGVDFNSKPWNEEGERFASAVGLSGAYLEIQSNDHGDGH